jgi:hypothetical protein
MNDPVPSGPERTDTHPVEHHVFFCWRQNYVWTYTIGSPSYMYINEPQLYHPSLATFWAELAAPSEVASIAPVNTVRSGTACLTNKIEDDAAAKLWGRPYEHFCPCW